MSHIHEFQVEFTQRTARVKSLDIHPTQPWILIGLYSGTVEIWNYELKRLEKSFKITDNVPVRSAKFVAQKGWIVTGSDDMFIRVYDYNTQEKVKEFKAHEDYIRCIAVHPTLPYVLSTSDDHYIKLWDLEKDWICGQIFEGHSHYVMQVVFNPKDHKNFVSVSLDGSIKIWNLSNSNPIASLDAHQKGMNCVNYLISEAKLYLLTGSDDYTAKVWDYDSLSCIKVLEGHKNNVTTMLAHPKLPLILTGSEDKNIHIWNATTYMLEMTLDQGLGRAWTVEYEKSSCKIFIGYDEGWLIGNIVVVRS